MLMKKVLFDAATDFTMPYLCWSMRRLHVTPSPRPTTTRPHCEFSEISRKAVIKALEVPSHCTFVGRVAEAVRTGGLRTLANATTQQ